MKSKPDPFEQAVHRAQQGKHWRRPEAIVVVRRWKASGLSIEQFAREHELPHKRIRWWKRRLGDEPALHSDESDQTPHFVELQIAPQSTSLEPVTAPAMTPSAPALEIVLRGQRRVRVCEGFDALTLARLVEVLEAVPC